MISPTKLKFILRFRNIIDSFPMMLPLPKINPNLVSISSVVTSILFLVFLNNSYLAAFFLFLTLLLDWFDGLIAKKFGLCSRKGYIVDLVSDRLSEAIIFIPFFVPWFILFLVNLFLVLISFRTKRHIILPLRFLFLIYFMFLIL